MPNKPHVARSISSPDRTPGPSRVPIELHLGSRQSARLLYAPSLYFWQEKRAQLPSLEHQIFRSVKGTLTPRKETSAQSASARHRNMNSVRPPSGLPTLPMFRPCSTLSPFHRSNFLTYQCFACAWHCHCLHFAGTTSPRAPHKVHE
jgi:hypothetical protein